MTFTAEVTAPILKDVKSQAPKAICEMVPTFTLSNLLVNRDKPPFDNAQIRTAMAYAIDRSAFVQILSQGTSKVGGMMLPPPEGRWGLPPDILATIPGYGPDLEKNRAKAARSWRVWATPPTSHSRSRSARATFPSIAIRR